ncbi:sensor histidine kinase [Pseudomonas sp. RIT-PI-S]|uniref:sensor histidine kinase n=1 Tax=Pseudomonas sp. RIT-PI-S TaxID=3035295 RepID=UPI0021D90FF9|nr:sensor histidine kinase [Pseudomonas sp. RIT-PI-S]
MGLDAFSWAAAIAPGTSLLLLHLGLILLLCGLAWTSPNPTDAIALRPAELAGRMAKARENERERLSRELHDDIGQLLTAARLQLDWLGRRMPAALEPPVEILRDTLAECLSKVRNVSALLNPRHLASLGLEASLRDHLSRALAGSGLNWSLECRQRLDGLSTDMSIAAFRIVQEGVTNLLRHAQADNLWVVIAREKHGLAISIVDDGQGFDPAAVPAGRGIAGMAERAQALRGHVRVRSATGQGTQIDARLPWPDRAARRAHKGLA